MNAPPTNPKLLIRQSDHRFYLGMGIFMTLLVFLGFWRTYFQPLLNGTYEGSLVLHIHAIVFLSWMAVYLLQSTLVIKRRTPIHKRVGRRSMYLGALMFVLGLAVSVLLVQRFLSEGRVNTVAAGVWAASEPYVDIIQFAILLSLGFTNKKNPSIHKRYMLLTTIAILPAATARMGYLIGPWSMELFFLLFTALILIHDWRIHGKIFKANIIGLLILLPRALLATLLKF